MGTHKARRIKMSEKNILDRIKNKKVFETRIKKEIQKVFYFNEGHYGTTVSFSYIENLQKVEVKLVPYSMYGIEIEINPKLVKQVIEEMFPEETGE